MNHVGHKPIKIYESRWHLLGAFALVVVPLVFLMFFARFTEITFWGLLEDIGLSLYRLAIAYIIAATLAWGAAVWLYRGKRAAVGLPLFDVLQSFPTFAALPLAVTVWGKANSTVIVFLVLTIIWPMFFSIISSLKLIRRDWQEAVQMADLSGWAYVRWFLWPISVPGLITGSIIGLGEGWEAIIATEMIVGLRPGLGGFFQQFSQNVTITALGIVGFLLIIFSLNKLVWLPLLDISHRRMEE